MKYKPSGTSLSFESEGAWRKKYAGANARLKARRAHADLEEPIDIGALFSAPRLPQKYERASFFTRLWRYIKRLFSHLLSLVARHFARLRAKRERKRESLYMLCGALCASALVSLICAFAVVLSCFGRYAARYTAVTVPNLIGTEYDAPLDGENSLFSFVVDYEYNPEVRPGIVITQFPAAGTVRKIYKRRGHCTVSLTVSCARPRYTLPELCGFSERDATLELRNNGISVLSEYEYSSSVKSGTVMRASQPTGASLSYGDTVTLTVSKGEQIIYCLVPYLVGLTEMQAITKINAADLSLGNVLYSPSTERAGTVISQSIAPKTALAKGEKIDITVSSGMLELKSVPDLYGMTVIEAKEALRACGLVLGTVISVGSAEPKGTVIAQTPLPKTPITSSTVSVDVYISS